MQLKSVGYGASCTVSIGNMEFLKPSGSAEVSVDPGDDIDDVINYARKVGLQLFVVSAADLQLIMGYTGKYKQAFPAAIVKKIIEEITFHYEGK